VNIGGISRKTVAIYGAINFGVINLLLQKMEQFYGAIIWYHLMAPFYVMCVPGLTHSVPDRVQPSFVIFDIWALWCSYVQKVSFVPKSRLFSKHKN